MPSYKILGIYSFANTLKEVLEGDPVTLKHEKYNIKSKNAIGVYVKNVKKIGYLPIENNDELLNFKNSYKISKLQLNQEYPIVEISRYYDNINFIPNYEFTYIKKIKYDYKLIEPNKELTNSINSLLSNFKHRRINVKRIAITHVDDDYINIIVETSKGIETFNTITHKFFKENIDRYEELLEFNLIEHTFYKELMFHRIEKYIESNYTNITKCNFIKNDFFEMKIFEPIILLNKKIDLIYLTKLYLHCLIINDFKFVIKYLNQFTSIQYNNVEDCLEKTIENINILDSFLNTYELKLGGFYYDHTKKIYSEIDFINENSVIIISKEILDCDILNLANKKNLIIYNPFEGTINKLNI
jgi:hypothetical protein